MDGRFLIYGDIEDGHQTIRVGSVNEVKGSVQLYNDDNSEIAEAVQIYAGVEDSELFA